VEQVACLGVFLESKGRLPYLAGMTTLTITAKGQVTLKKELLRHLGAAPGQKIEVETLPGGAVVLRLARQKTGKISDVFGMFHDPARKPVSIEEMNETIAESWAGKR